MENSSLAAYSENTQTKLENFTSFKQVTGMRILWRDTYRFLGLLLLAGAIPLIRPNGDAEENLTWASHALVANSNALLKLQAIEAPYQQHVLANRASTPTISVQQPAQAPNRVAQEWYIDSDLITALASIGALIISLIALFISHRSANEQQTREKREELRGAIEKLVSLREEFTTKAYKTIDAHERQTLSSSALTKAMIYMQAAEVLAHDIPRHVSSSEYIVLGIENQNISDHLQAREFLHRAVTATNKEPSLASKAYARRVLAANYFQSPPKNELEGRRYYEDALNILRARDDSDYYMIITQALTYRDWAQQETLFGDKERAYRALSEAATLVQRLPDWYTLKSEELRAIAFSWKYLAGSYLYSSLGIPMQNPDLDSARELYSKSLSTIQHLDDVNTIDLRCQTLHEWSRNESAYGSQEQAIKCWRQAKAQFDSLPENYPQRDALLKSLTILWNALQPNVQH